MKIFNSFDFFLMPPLREVSLPPVDTVPESDDSSVVPDDTLNAPEHLLALRRRAASAPGSASVATRPLTHSLVAVSTSAPTSVVASPSDDFLDVSGDLRGSQRASFGSLLGASRASPISLS
jgi:hypothetical protein